jgi:hypothetical protein
MRYLNGTLLAENIDYVKPEDSIAQQAAFAVKHYRSYSNDELIEELRLMMKHAHRNKWPTGKFLSEPGVVAIMEVMQDRGLR